MTRAGSSRAEPVYRQLAAQLSSEIRARHQAGDLLPSEGQLTQRFGVNRHTLRRALEELILTGQVERRHGVGTYVLDRAIEYQLGRGSRFTQALTELGHTAATEVLERGVIPAVAGVAMALRLDLAAPVVWLETLRLVDRRPFCLISHFLPAARFPGLAQLYQGGSLHTLLAQEFGLTLRRTSSLIAAMAPRASDGSRLQTGRLQPVLRVKSVNLDAATGLPAEYAVTRFRADRVQLQVDF